MSDWKSKVAKKQEELRQLTPTEWLIADRDATPYEEALLEKLSLEQLEITTNYTAQELLAALAAGKLTAEAVTDAFSRRAALANQYVNCLTEVNYKAALTRAKHLDEEFKKTGKPVGPLHGLPISVKDSFEVTGLASTLGTVARIDHPKSHKNTPLVQLLLDLGAVVHVKTNIPQAIITSDSHNNVFGRTLNPYNTKEWSAGGSSGGEAALIALRGSLLGVGTDLAGSIRIPAWCCGVYGFKPTVNRIPYSGIATSSVDLADLGVLASAGPLATNISDIEFFMKTVIDNQPWIGYDSLAIPMPWISNINKHRKTSKPEKKGFLTFGTILEDDLYPVDSDVQQCLQNISFKLVGAGHKHVQLLSGAYPSFRHVSHSIALPLLDLDVSRASLKMIQAGQEPLVPSVKKNFAGVYDPPSKTFDETEELFITSVKESFVSIPQLLEATRRKLSARKAWLDVINAQGIDILILPCAAQFAPPFDTYTELPYTNNWNALDFPAIAIPTNRDKLGKVDSKVKPHGIQVVGTYFNDEGLLAAASLVDSIINGSN